MSGFVDLHVATGDETVWWIQWSQMQGLGFWLNNTLLDLDLDLDLDLAL